MSKRMEKENRTKQNTTQQSRKPEPLMVKLLQNPPNGHYKVRVHVSICSWHHLPIGLHWQIDNNLIYILKATFLEANSYPETEGTHLHTHKAALQ